MRKRDKAITIRMTEEEYALLCSKLAQTGISQQAFVINAITGIAIIPSEQTAVLKEISSTFASGIRELEKISQQISGYRKDSEEIWQSIRSSIAQQRATVQ